MMTENNHYLGYIGTYTKGESKGIYSFKLDTIEKTIVDIKLAATLENPTYLTISDNQQYLYSVGKKGELGGVAAFSIEANGELTSINAMSVLIVKIDIFLLPITIKGRQNLIILIPKRDPFSPLFPASNTRVLALTLDKKKRILIMQD
jgi:hypothetical protein